MKSLRTNLWAALVYGFLLAVVLPAGPAWADPVLDNRVDVGLTDALPADTFRSIAEMANLDVAVDPAVRGPVTIRVRNVRLETVLDAICESIGCEWRLVPGSPPQLRIKPLAAGSGRAAEATPEDPIDIKVIDAEVRNLLQTFAMLGGFELDLSPEVTGQVTIELDNTPYNKALDQVCRAAGCVWKILPGTPQKLRITPAKK